MADYSKGFIYIITTGDDFYVGSAVDLKRRIREHKSRIFNENNEGYNFKYCKKIRENNDVLNMEIYKHFPCNNKRELEQEEQRVMDELKPTLNEKDAYQTKEELRMKAIEKITCECGCKITRSNIQKHRRTAKHIKLMEQINLNK